MELSNTPTPQKKKIIIIIILKLFFTLNKTPLGETGYLVNFYYLLAGQVSSFLIQPLYQTQSVGTPLVPCCAVLLWLVGCHWSPSTSHPTLSREAEDFLRGGKYPNDVPLPTFLAYLQPVKSKIVNSYLYVSKS